MAEKSPEELYKERRARIDDAAQLRIPDRVPVHMSFGYFPARYYGISASAAFYETDKWLAATKKTVADFAPDGIYYIYPAFPGKAMELLDPKAIKWPGHGVPEQYSHRAIECEFLKHDEYDLILSDSSDFNLRTLMPRSVGAMEAFSELPPLSSLGAGYSGAILFAEALARPDVSAALARLQEIGRLASEWRKNLPDFDEEIKALGVVVDKMRLMLAAAPFDQVSDYLRGMTGTMTDMYRQPDKLIELMDRQLQETLKLINSTPKRDDNPIAWSALHRGSDGFMSLKDFEKFYWPGLKSVVEAVVERGIIPGLFFEGDWSQRLEYLTELPKGRVVGHFDYTNIFRAKEVLKDHMCIMGNVPVTLLQTGSVQDVKGYVKELIDVVGKDGGLIVCPGVVPDTGKPENIHAMIDFTKEYGIYN